MNQAESQRDALEDIEHATVQLSSAAAKLRVGDLRGAQARIGFALRNLGRATQQITAAWNDTGYLPPNTNSEEKAT